jgi:hypothetical protein
MLIIPAGTLLIPAVMLLIPAVMLFIPAVMLLIPAVMLLIPAVMLFIPAVMLFIPAVMLLIPPVMLLIPARELFAVPADCSRSSGKALRKQGFMPWISFCGQYLPWYLITLRRRVADSESAKHVTVFITRQRFPTVGGEDGFSEFARLPPTTREYVTGHRIIAG